MHSVSRPALALIAALCVAAGDAAAQEARRPRPHFDFGLGVTRRVPVYGDEGLGPIASVTLHLPSTPSGSGVLIGASYGIVFTDGWTDPDGVRYDYAPEAVIFAIGPEFVMGERREFTIDVQWNPAVAHVRRWGRVPPWPTGPDPWQQTFAVGSLGARYTLPGSRGPQVGITLRTFVLLHPYVWMHGGREALWPALGVVVRPR